MTCGSEGNRFTRTFHNLKSLNRRRRVAQAFSLLYRRLPVGTSSESVKALQVENLRYSRLESLRYVKRREISGFNGFLVSRVAHCIADETVKTVRVALARPHPAEAGG